MMNGTLIAMSISAVLLAAPVLAGVPVYDIAPVDNIEIDGEADDWGERGFRVELVPDPEGRFLPADDFDASFRLGWDADGLYMLAMVRDDTAAEHEELRRLWQKDCVEIFLAEKRGHQNMYQFVAASGADGDFGSIRAKLYDHRPEEIKTGELETVQASSIGEGGYIIEAFFPWKNLGAEGRKGLETAFQFIANDIDGGRGPSFRTAWFPQIGAHEDTELMHTIRLADSPSPPVTLHAARRSTFEGCVVTITGAEEEKGSPFEVTAAARRLDGVLGNLEGRAGVSVVIEETTDDGMYPPVRAAVSGLDIAAFGEVPSMRHVLGRYVEAVGGRDPMKKIESRRCVCRSTTELSKRGRMGGDQGDRPGDVTEFDMTVDARGRWLYHNHSADPPIKRGYDGADGWVQDENGIHREDLSGWGVTVWWIDPRGPMRFDDYFDGLEMVEANPDEGGNIYVARGSLPTGRELRFVFDAGTGLLKKAGRLHMTNHREIDGVLIPHLVYFDDHGSRTKFIIDEVRHNVSVDEGMFDVPDPGEEYPHLFSGITDERVLPMLKDLPTVYGGMNVPAADGRFLYDLIIEKGYRRGLEIGTSNGYSTLWIGLAFRETGGEVITIEYEKRRALEAQENFEKAGLDGVIDLRINDAFEEIPTIEGEFDFIFIDAWKPDYIKFLEMIRNRVVPGGAIAAHNVIAQERSMRDFLGAIENDPGLETVYIEKSSEGISLSMVKK